MGQRASEGKQTRGLWRRVRVQVSALETARFRLFRRPRRWRGPLPGPPGHRESTRRTPPDWQTDAWHLERSRPETWGRQQRVAVRLTMDAAAKKVAEELGLTLAHVLAEAELLLWELDHEQP